MLHPIYTLKEKGLKAEYNADMAYNALQDFLTFYADGEETWLEATRAWADVLYSRALQSTGKPFFLDKTPRYYLIIPELYRLFPEAKFVFLIRNPLAVLHSIIDRWVKEDWPRLARYRQDLLVAPNRLLEATEVMGDKAICIHYEALVNKPGETVSQLCGQLDVPFDPEMLNYGTVQAPQGRYGDKTGVRQNTRPIVDSTNKWKQLALQSQAQRFAIAYLDALGADCIEKLGYSYSDLRNLMMTNNPRSSVLNLSWQTVIRPQDTWTLKEKFLTRFILSIQKNGLGKG